MAESTCDVAPGSFRPKLWESRFCPVGSPLTPRLDICPPIATQETPWPVTFSFGRAFVDQALHDWQGADVDSGQRALSARVGATAAVLGGTVSV